MSFRFTIKMKGVEKVDRVFDNTAKLPKNLAPMFEDIGRILRNEWGDFFKTEYNGRWKALETSTQEDRERGGYGREHPIGQRTGNLKRSVSVKGAKDNISEVKKDSARFGFSGVGYYFDRLRTILDLTDNAKKLIMIAVRKYVVKEVKK